MKQPTSYLPLKKFHIIPINGLSPESIKSSVKNASRDREKVSYNTLLNACANALGVKGGIAGYKTEYETKLKPFMQEHNLTTLTDLVSPKFSGYDSPRLRLTYQDISERFFYSSKPIPKAIFTGYDFHYDRHFDDGNYIAHVDLGITQDISKKIQWANDNPDKEMPVRGNKYCNMRSLLDIIIGSEMLFIIQPGFNIIGDQLTIPKGTNIPELCLYQRSPENIDSENELFNMFVKRVKNLEGGWVDVIPYNDNLIFLKGKNGEYSFVFRNQRDKLFQHDSQFEPYLRLSEIPSFVDDYHFKRWYYFEYEGFRAEDLHEAEDSFYESGGSIGNYPGILELLKSYYHTDYSKTLKSLNTNKKLPNFQRVKISDQSTLMVSDLISIEDFEKFKRENTEYFTRRSNPNLSKTNLDTLETANNEVDRTLPVALTGYDVLKYIDWFNSENDVEARLLSLDEYLAITPYHQLVMDEKNRDSVYSSEQYCFFVDSNGDKTRQPPYMDEKDFQSLNMYFNSPKFVVRNNLRFMDSHFFAEWLQDFSCIRSNSLTSFSGDQYFRHKPPFASTGRYKYIKIGFRLCYEFEA